MPSRCVINTVGKDPFVGKTTEVVYKAKEGTWTFQGFTNAVIKTTYKPNDYSKTEQVSDAVVTKPPAVNYQNNKCNFPNRGVGKPYQCGSAAGKTLL